MSKCINDAGDQRTVDKQGVGDFGFLAAFDHFSGRLIKFFSKKI